MGHRQWSVLIREGCHFVFNSLGNSITDLLSLLLGLLGTVQVCSGLFDIFRNCSEAFIIVRDCSGLFDIVRVCSGLFEDCSGEII